MSIIIFYLFLILKIWQYNLIRLNFYVKLIPSDLVTKHSLKFLIGTERWILKYHDKSLRTNISDIGLKNCLVINIYNK